MTDPDKSQDSAAQGGSQGTGPSTTISAASMPVPEQSATQRQAQKMVREGWESIDLDMFAKGKHVDMFAKGKPERKEY